MPAKRESRAAVEASVRGYFKEMARFRPSPDDRDPPPNEESTYEALAHVLGELGGRLQPPVSCVIQPKTQGPHRPDIGLYCGELSSKRPPDRGVIEVKLPSADLSQVAESDQARKYCGQFGPIVITNHREFRLIEFANGDKPRTLEAFKLAVSETDFWKMTESPETSARKIGWPLGNFLLRIMQRPSLLKKPEEVARHLATYAHDALARLNETAPESDEGVEDEDTPLGRLRKGLELALGRKFKDKEGNHFFHSVIVQTLFYGLFSAWVVSARAGNKASFDWRAASQDLNVPMIQTLFHAAIDPESIGPLGIADILDRAAKSLNRIDQDAFFETFDSEEAVQHFYEPFLEEFDPELRKRMGVWYTPREIVRYMVERVDTVLRTELDRPDGLADSNVYVLDPCCGTGAYVVEVLKKIEETLRGHDDDALVGEAVKEAALERVFGFELMPAPFVIAHWQVGNLLAGLNVPLRRSASGQDGQERAAIYLTNALTGWEPPTGPKAKIPWLPALEKERDQAENVKREAKILVVLGNPPYNAHGGTSPIEEGGLVKPYKDGLDEWGIKKDNLNDFYARFLRIAERKIVENGQGLICYISSFSYLRGVSFVSARRHLLGEFDRIWIDNLNGSSRETKKRTPEGKPDPSAFSTPSNQAGIQLGTAIGLFLKRPKPPADTAVVTYRDFWGTSKRQDLEASLNEKDFDKERTIVDPQEWNGFSFRPSRASDSYLSWPTLKEFSDLAPLDGLMEKRGGALIDIDSENLVDRMEPYYDSAIKWPMFQQTGHPLLKEYAGHDPWKARKKVINSSEGFDRARIVPYVVRPFDIRYAYYTNISTVWNRSRPDLWEQFSGKNRFLMSRRSRTAIPEGPPVFFTTCLGDNDALLGHARYFPLLKHDKGKNGASRISVTTANLSVRARAWLADLGVKEDPDHNFGVAVMPWLHAIAITYAPRYLDENASGIGIDWPRVPLPNDLRLLEASAKLGAQVAALLDSKEKVVGVTEKPIASHLRVVGAVSGTDRKMTAQWGSRAGEKTMPGPGKTELRDWTDDEVDRLREGFATKDVDISEKRGFALLGRAIDVYLNETTCWSGVPESTWNYVIGGYQVIKKWLSYRESSILQVLLGRERLTNDELLEVKSMARRITALILLSDKLDENFAACRDCLYDWPSPEALQ